MNQVADGDFAPEFWPAGRLLRALGILCQSHIRLILRRGRRGWDRRQLGRARDNRGKSCGAASVFDEGSISLEADFAEVSCGIKASLRGETPVVVGERESARVRCIPHLPLPVERTQRIGTGWSNVAPCTRLRVSNVERERSGNSRDTKVIPRSARKSKLIHDRGVLQGNGYCVICDFHGVVGNLQNPKKPIRSDSRIEIVQLGRQTDVPKVQSYKDERAVRPRRCGSSPCVGRNAAKVIALIDADVGDDCVRVALVVLRGAEGISHGHMTLEVGDLIGFGVLAIQKGPNPWGKVIKECGREKTPGRYGLGREKNISARYGYW